MNLIYRLLRFAVLAFFWLLLGALLSVASAHANGANAFSVNADLTYASKYMSDGFKIGGDHPVWEPSLWLTTPVPGVSAMLWSSIQMDRQNQQYDEYDLMARYSQDFMRGSRWAYNLHGYYDYWTYPKINIEDLTRTGPDSLQNMHGNKLHAGVSMVNLLPIEGSYLVPTYNLYYWLYWAQNRSDRFEGGAHHEFMLNYYHDVPRIFSGSIGQYVGGGASLNYNDGVFNVQPGWSHTIAQISTGIYGQGWVCSASVNRQWSYISSVDPDNELWSTLSFTKQF